MAEQQQSAVAWFEIPCADLDRARTFYETILGVTMTKIDPGTPNDAKCIFPAPQGGAAGALVKRPTQRPGVPGTLMYLSCDGHLDEVIDRVDAAGGSIVTQRTPVPSGFGSFACLKDTEGNHVGLHTAV
jgi:predicted enzyme related to lactoylglutathione lyase